MDGEDIILAIFLGLTIGIFFTWVIVSAIGIDLTQETGDDICKQLTGNETAVASDWDENGYGKLICILPSYDSTQNIIVKENN